jgi:hypothetical protein
MGLILWVVDKLSEILFHRVLERGVSFWRHKPRQAIALLAFTGVTGATGIVLAGVLPNLIYVPLYAIGDDRPLGILHAQMLNRLAARLEDRLFVSLEQMHAETSDHDTWTYADIIAGLGPKALASNGKFNHRQFFKQHMKPGQYCWTQFKRSVESQDPCHNAATAWILFGLTTNKIPPDPEMWSYLLSQQSPEGWWSVYQDSQADIRNASTYATAISLLVLESGLSLNAIPAKLVPLSQQRASRARVWLLQQRAPSCLWPDYPNRPNEWNFFVSVSGVAVHALISSREKGLNEAVPECLEKFTAAQFKPTEKDTSGVLIRLNDGRTANDSISHQKLVWSAIALADIYPELSIVDKARVRRHLASVLFSGPAMPEAGLDYPWQLGEFAIMVRELQNE